MIRTQLPADAPVAGLRSDPLTSPRRRAGHHAGPGAGGRRHGRSARPQGRLARIAGACWAMLLILAAGVAHAGDPANGRRVAERWCSSCHVVAGRGGTDAAPTLESIARDRRREPDWVRQWLSAPHPPMPDPNLTRAEIEDVVAYLESLAP